MGQSIQDVIPHIAPQIIPIFQSVLDSAKPILNHEVRGPTSSNPDEDRVFIGDHTPLFSQDGKVLYVHTMVREVTEQRRAEMLLKEANEKLEARVLERTAELQKLSAQLTLEAANRTKAEEAARASEERMRRLLESTHIIPWEADARTWKFTYVGPQVALLGYPVDRWYEKDFWINHIHPEDREEAVNFCVTKSRQGGDHEFEYRMIASDGREVWIHDLVNAELSDGEPAILRGFMIDITDQKHAQIELLKSRETFRALLQASPDGVAIVDRNGMIGMTNEKMADLFGYSDNGMEGISIDQLVPNKARGKHRAHREKDAAIPAARPMAAELDLQGKRKDGSSFPVDFCLSPLTLEGEMMAACFVRDITKRKRREEKERQRNAELTHISRVSAMGELVASISHELNQPLTAILANAQAALRFMEPGNPDMREIKDIFQDIVRDDKRADRIIRRLRTLLQSHSVTKTSLRLDELVDQVMPLIRSSALTQNVTIKLEAAPDLPPIEADSVQLQQVIINLLMNAIDAVGQSQSDGKEVLVAISSIPGDSIKFAVSDNGPGIPTEDLEKIFTAFFTTKPKGLGMGLSICKTIIEAHSGFISVENLKPKGCCISFVLPTKRTASS